MWNLLPVCTTISVHNWPIITCSLTSSSVHEKSIPTLINPGRPTWISRGFDHPHSVCPSSDGLDQADNNQQVHLVTLLLPSYHRASDRFLAHWGNVIDRAAVRSDWLKEEFARPLYPLESAVRIQSWEARPTPSSMLLTKPHFLVSPLVSRRIWETRRSRGSGRLRNRPSKKSAECFLTRRRTETALGRVEDRSQLFHSG